MAIHNKSDFERFVRGADTWWHQRVMLLGNIGKNISLAFFVSIVLWATLIFTTTSSLERKIITARTHASLCLLINAGCSVSLPDPSGGSKRIRANPTQALNLTSDVLPYKTYLLIMLTTFFSTAIGFGVFKKITADQLNRGLETEKDLHLRGGELCEDSELATLVKNELGDSSINLKVGPIPIPDRVLNLSMSVAGDSGSGKTQFIYTLLDSFRDNVPQAIIYTRNGGEINRYFMPERGDFILNFNDIRSKEWSVLAEIYEESDISSLGERFGPIQTDGENAIFAIGGRMILEDSMRVVLLDPERPKTMLEVFNFVSLTTEEVMKKTFMEYGLASATLFGGSTSGEDMRKNLTTSTTMRFFKRFENLEETKFSLRSWIKSGQAGWMFLSTSPTKHDELAPFMACWLDVAIMEAMHESRSESQTKLVNPNLPQLLVVLDELPTLPKLKAIKTSLTEGRKFGIMTVLGFQNVSQFDDIYGQNDRKTILSNAQTLICFKSGDADSAEYLSKTLGEKEIIEIDDGTSYGDDPAQDKVSLNNKRQSKRLVIPGEIQNLKPGECFVRIPYVTGVAKTKTNMRDLSMDVIRKDGEGNWLHSAYLYKTIPVAAGQKQDDGKKTDVFIEAAEWEGY